MKKFSKVADLNVGKIVKEDKQVSEYQEIRASIMMLIDNSLKLTSYGSARQEIQATTKITGKEILVEALINLFKDKEVATAVKSLELLKETIHDWVNIDQSIDTIKESHSCFTFLNNNNIQVEGMLRLMERITDDNIEPLMERLITTYSDDSLAFNESLINNMLKSKQYDSKKLEQIRTYFIKK